MTPPLFRRPFAPEEYLFEDLVDEMTRQGKTQSLMATESDLSQTTISRVLTTRGCTLNTFQRMAKILGLKLILVEEKEPS